MSRAAKDVAGWREPRFWLDDPFEHQRPPAVAPLRSPKAALLTTTGLTWAAFR